MRIILSPAKTMRREETILPETVPVFLEQAQELVNTLQALTPQERKAVWNCSDRLASQNEERLAGMNLHGAVSPALYSYSGLAFTHLSPESLTDAEISYLQKRLRILSGLYGILKPLDGIVPYRLEMGAGLKTDRGTDLYSFWGSLPAEQLFSNEDTVINLASEEYSRLIRPWVSAAHRMIDVIFAEEKNGKLRIVSTAAKMARGKMTRWLAEERIGDPQEMRRFDYGYRFAPEKSDETHYYFIKIKGKGTK